jgi:hypothetical protein
MEREPVMYLKEIKTGNLVEVLNLNDLFNPCHNSIIGRYHVGEEMQDATEFFKINLAFPSSESLPTCWTDAHYRSDTRMRQKSNSE